LVLNRHPYAKGRATPNLTFDFNRAAKEIKQPRDDMESQADLLRGNAPIFPEYLNFKVRRGFFPRGELTDTFFYHGNSFR
jgi:hypothetical protein